MSDIPKKTVPEVSAPIVRTQTVATIGTEQGYPLSDLEFSILVRGEQASGDQGLRAAAWGVFATAVATLIAIYLTFTTDDIVRKGTTAIMLFYALVGIAVTSLAAIVLASLRLRMIRRDPVYHNLIAKIRRILTPYCSARSRWDPAELSGRRRRASRRPPSPFSQTKQGAAI